MEVDVSTHFSFSKLDTYRDCPRRYRYRYVDRIKRERRTAESFLGSCVHASLEDLYRHLQQGRTMPWEEFLAVFDGHWAAGWSDAIEIHDKRLAADDFKKVGKDCLWTYYEAHAPFADGKSHEVEKKLSMTLAVDVDGEQEEYHIDGIMDRLSFPRGRPDAVEVHDYKTGAHLPTQDQVDEMFQFQVYDLLVRRQFPRTRSVKVFLHYLRFGRALEPGRDPAVDEGEKTKAELASLIRAVKRDHAWEPRRSHLCDWCEYRDICPLWSHASALKALAPERRRKDEGLKLVDQLAALEERKGEVKKEEERVRKALIELASSRMGEGERTVVVSGTESEVVVTEKEECKFPTKTHAPEQLARLEDALKETPIWKEVSHLDGHLLMKGYAARPERWGPDLLAAVESLLSRYARTVREKHLRFRRKKGEEESG
ncbi:MAG: PD-(D/E)XK nuclease family protein [Elusimicrobia bacterium]|nr:PD-(D/E)XK nuclease family protein [Elusimicrobiota bacterium]